MPMRTIELKRFLREVKDRHTMQRARPFCFILGAGASKQSDIPMGRELVDRWLAVLHHDAEVNHMPVEQWATAKSLGIKGFVYARREEFYGQIYARRFAGTQDTGHAEMQSLLSGKEPSYGYSILAYILANTPHKAVITTNFDNLVADALYLYSNTAPILCVHESLARFITAQLDRPLVVKIHRDLLLDPRNADDEIDKLDTAWDAPLHSLLSHFTPIFIGYGGNDGSLMGFLNKLPPGVPDRLYWCVRAGSPPNEIVKALLDKKDGTLVTIPGFDEIMLALKDALGIPDLLPDLEDRHRKRVDRYTLQFSELSKATVQDANAPSATPDQKTLGDAATAAVQQLSQTDTPDSWILRAKAEPDKIKAESIYREALAKHPQDGALRCAFGEFLADQKQAFDEAEALIKSAYDADPESPDRVQDYGRFLWYSKGDGRQAEPLLRSAVAMRTTHLGPEHPSLLSSRSDLANALIRQGKNAEAEQEHRAVLEIRQRVHGAEHPDTLESRNNLAIALANQGRHAEAEQEHRAVLAIKQRILGVEHPDTLPSRNNLALTLADQGKHTGAEQEHRAVLEIRQRILGMEHPDTLSSRNNLAIALANQGRRADSEQELRSVLEIRQRVLGAEHPDVFLSCFNLAQCLEAQKKGLEALGWARRALDGWRKVFGEEHPDTRDAQGMVDRLSKLK